MAFFTNLPFKFLSEHVLDFANWRLRVEDANLLVPLPTLLEELGSHTLARGILLQRQKELLEDSADLYLALQT